MTFKDHLVQLFCNEQGHAQLGQVAQSPLQSDFEGLQEWGIYNLHGQPIPVPHHPPCKRLFPYIQPKSTLFKLEAIPPCSITTDHAKASVPFFPVTPL